MRIFRQHVETVIATGLLCCSPWSVCLAETVALWGFDEPVTVQRGGVLKDASGNGFDLELGDGRIVPTGRFEHGLLCPSNVADFVARRANVQGTPLNLGNFDWTIEWWQKRSGSLAQGYVDWTVLVCDQEIVSGDNVWELGFKAEPRFLAAGLWHHDRARSWFGKDAIWPCFADKYDEVRRLAFVQDVNPQFYLGLDQQFHHVAWVYDAAIKRLMYFEDGRGPYTIRDGTPVTPGNQTHPVYGMVGTGDLKEYPDSYQSYGQLGSITFYLGGENVISPRKDLALGIAKIPRGYDLVPRPRKDDTVSSVIDELRISNEVRYREPFSPPVSFIADDTSAGLVVTPRRLDFLMVDGGPVPTLQTIEVSRHDVSLQADVAWLKIKPLPGRGKGSRQRFRIDVDDATLWPMLHRGTISVQPHDTKIAPQTIEVTINVEVDGHVTWLFDEPPGAPQRMHLEDLSRNGYDLILGPRGRIVAGRYGQALDPRGGRRGHAAVRRYIDPTHLNLGNFPWSWQGWFQLAEPAAEGDVLFEIRENVAVGPYPNIRGVGHQTALTVGPDAKSLVFINGPAGINQPLPVAGDLLRKPSPDWFHLALAWDPYTRELRLGIDGQLHSSSRLANPPVRLRPTGENTLALGTSVDGSRPWRGLIDEVRVSVGQVHGSDFQSLESLAPQHEPVVLKAGPHLFIDDFLVNEKTNIRRTYHKAEFPVDQPSDWEHFKRQLANQGDTHIADLGSDSPDPRRRFLNFSYVHTMTEASDERGGIYCFYAPTADGPWVAYDKNPVLPYVWAGQPHQYYAVSDHWPVIFDPATRQLVMFYKTYPMTGQHPVLDWYRDERFNYQNRVIAGFRRHQGIAFSKDGFQWWGLQHVLVPDDWDEGETQFQTPKLYKRGDLYIAFVQDLRDDVERSVASVSVATSRDLFHWIRHREPLIPWNPAGGSGDKWFHVEGNTEIYSDGQQMILPIRVGGSHKPPRGFYHGFARLPIDRFASLDSIGTQTGKLQTPLLSTKGQLNSLCINADISDGGELRVQVVDESGEVIPGFSFKNCVPLHGDQVKHRVQWRGESSIALLAGKPVRLEFAFHHARLFAFYLVGPDWEFAKDYRQSAAERDAEQSQVRNDQQLTDGQVRDLLNLAPQLRERDSPLVTRPSIIRIQRAYPEGHAYPGDPEPVELFIEPAGQHTSWKVVERVPWLEVQPKAGTGSGSVLVQPRGMQLGRGDYLGAIRIQQSGESRAPLDVPVYFRLTKEEMPN